MSENDVILYTSEDGMAQFTLRQLGGQVWLTQLEIAELYQTSKQNISKHVKGIFSEQELAEEAVVNRKLTTASDGKEYLTQLPGHVNIRLISAFTMVMSAFALKSAPGAVRKVRC